MKAIVVTGTTDAPTLVWQDVDDLAYGVDEVLVRVGATAVNRADLSQARGNYPPPKGASPILGLEMAGTIEAMGANVTGWQVGDRVCALLPGGGYAEQVVVPAGMLMRLPEGWGMEMGTAVPEVWFTAYVNLFLEGDLKAGETVLIHAGGSGVGTAAIQLANAIGATVIATAGAEFKLDKCRELGATYAINYKEQDFYEVVMEVTENQGVDLVLDPVGGDYFHRNLKVLRRFGRLVCIGLLSGGRTEASITPILRNRLQVIGSTLRTRPVAEKVAITRQFSKQFWPLLLDGTLQPVIDRTFSIEQAQGAHAYVAQNKNLGKVILLVQ